MHTLLMDVLVKCVGTYGNTYTIYAVLVSYQHLAKYTVIIQRGREDLIRFLIRRAASEQEVR